MTQKEADISQHLKRYIRELNEEKLGGFLRFCAGSDLLSGHIKVEFTQSTFSRQPHLWNGLKPFDSYDHLPELCSEFNSILESNIWIVDIMYDVGHQLLLLTCYTVHYIHIQGTNTCCHQHRCLKQKCLMHTSQKKVFLMEFSNVCLLKKNVFIICEKQMISS